MAVEVGRIGGKERWERDNAEWAKKAKPRKERKFVSDSLSRNGYGESR